MHIQTWISGSIPWDAASTNQLELNFCFMRSNTSLIMLPKRERINNTGLEGYIEKEKERESSPQLRMIFPVGCFSKSVISSCPLGLNFLAPVHVIFTIYVKSKT